MWLMKILSMTVYLHLSRVSGACVDQDTIRQDGKRIISSVFKMVDSVSLYECVSRCLTVSTCKSVSYQRETRTCHLASQDSAGDPGDVHTDPEFFLTDISLWPKRLAGPCRGMTCTSGRCDVDRFNNPRCVSDDEVGCGPAPYLANANKSSTGQYEGAVTQYTCLSDFLFCGTSSTHTCSSLGTWEGLSGDCNRAVWYNPRPVKTRTFYKVVKAMPCPMTEGFKVIFEGRPVRYRRVLMVVKTNKLVVEADARLRYGNFRDLLFIHTQINGTWETHVQVPSTFAVGVHFTCKIVRRNMKYEIYIDESFVGSTEDETPELHPDTIEVSNDAQMDRISFSPVGGWGYASRYGRLRNYLVSQIEVDVTGNVGRRSSFEVTVGDMVVFSKLRILNRI